MVFHSPDTGFSAQKSTGAVCSSSRWGETSAIEQTSNQLTGFAYIFQMQGPSHDASRGQRAVLSPQELPRRLSESGNQLRPAQPRDHHGKTQIRKSEDADKKNFRKTEIK